MGIMTWPFSYLKMEFDTFERHVICNRSIRESGEEGIIMRKLSMNIMHVIDICINICTSFLVNVHWKQIAWLDVSM